jgi:hypothetical protein
MFSKKPKPVFHHILLEKSTLSSSWCQDKRGCTGVGRKTEKNFIRMNISCALSV